MTEPDLTEPIIGFRAWYVTLDGTLEPWSAVAAGAWAPGVNTAVCLVRPTVRSHVAPMRRCSCGIYALANVRDRRLAEPELAVGAIAAWGDIEVHATGFRAQHAAIVALGLRADCAPEHRRRLTLAAERYGVPLVPFPGLPAAAGEYGRRLDAQHAFDQAGRPTEVGPVVPHLSDVGCTGIAIDKHAQITITPAGVTVAPTGALAAEIVLGPSSLHPVGEIVQRGDPLVEALGRGGTILLPAPFSGRLTVVPSEGGGPSESSVELTPSDWEREAPELTWGAGAAGAYALELAQAAHRGDPFAQVRAHWLQAHAHVSSASDVLAALRRAREAPRFASEEEVYEQIGARLRKALRDPGVIRGATRSNMRIIWRLHEPGAEILLDLTTEPPTVVVGSADARADLTVYASAVSADRYFRGRIDMPAALRRREIQSSAPMSTVLRAESVLKAIKPAYAALVEQERAGRG